MSSCNCYAGLFICSMVVLQSNGVLDIYCICIDVPRSSSELIAMFYFDILMSNAGCLLIRTGSFYTGLYIISI